MAGSAEEGCMKKQRPFSRLCRALVFGVVGSALSACGPVPVHGPSKAKVDSQLATVVAKNKTYPAASLEAGSLRFEAGMWTRYKTVDDQGNPGVVTTNLLESDGQRHAWEVVSLSYYSWSANYFEASFDPQNPSAGVELHRVVTKEQDGNPEEMSQHDLELMRKFVKAPVADVFNLQQGAETRDINVPAGSFLGCSAMHSTLDLGPWSTETTSWMHPAVPFQGVVYAESSGGMPGTQELIDFGFDGQPSVVLGVVR